jgi:predicted RecA/RadA family phage recombinase
MAQTGFVLSDEGRSITLLNDSGTTAIEAGDIVFSAANDDVLTQTAASARNAYAAGDIKGKSQTDSATGYQTVLGVALEDIPADGYGAVAMEGVFIHATVENLEAGGLVQGDENASNKVAVADEFGHKIGYALTGGSADTEYVVWKFSK